MSKAWCSVQKFLIQQKLYESKHEEGSMAWNFQTLFFAMEYEEERKVLKEFKLKIFDEVEPEDVVYRLKVQEVITEGECETITKLVNIIPRVYKQEYDTFC